MKIKAIPVLAPKKDDNGKTNSATKKYYLKSYRHLNSTKRLRLRSQL